MPSASSVTAPDNDLFESEQERFRLLLETTKAIPWEADPKTWLFTYVGPQAVTLLGYPRETWLEDGFWTSHIHPEDRDGAVEFCLSSSMTSQDYDFHYRMIAADGSIIWIHDLVNVVRQVDGRPTKLRGFMIDVTERMEAEEALRASESELRRSHQELQVLAGKLLSAQEEERHRLAHELHDDLTQRLAALAIEAGRLASSADLETVGRGLVLIREQIVALSADVHRMSHRLHPTILDDLGLVDAMEAECRSFSEREAIAVEFRALDMNTEPAKETSLCLYRVAQECLNNIGKHSHATRAAVTLACSENTLTLSVEDAGDGFEVKQAVGGRRGLGLASMEERVRLLEGSFSVRSKPGQGTVVRVAAPLRLAG